MKAADGTAPAGAPPARPGTEIAFPKLYLAFCAAIAPAAVACALAMEPWTGNGGEIPFVGAVWAWLACGFLTLVRGPGRISAFAPLVGAGLRLAFAGTAAAVALGPCKVLAMPWLAAFSLFYLIIFLFATTLGAKARGAKKVRKWKADSAA